MYKDDGIGVGTDCTSVVKVGVVQLVLMVEITDYVDKFGNKSSVFSVCT